jgi:hypothetical protein
MGEMPIITPLIYTQACRCDIALIHDKVDIARRENNMIECGESHAGFQQHTTRVINIC